MAAVLSGAMIYVKDLAGMAEFYGGVLGWRPVEETRTSRWVEFGSEGGRLALHAIPDEIDARIEITSPPRVRESNPVKLMFRVDDLAEVLARHAALGIAATERMAGVYDACDPEGNVFQIRGQRSRRK